MSNKKFPKEPRGKKNYQAPPFTSRRHYGKRKNYVLFNRSLIVVILLLFQVFLLLYVLLKLTEYTSVLLAVNFLLSFVLAIFIVNQPINPAYKMAWLTLMCLLPFFGALFYLFVQFDPRSKKMQARITQRIKETSPYLQANDNVLHALKQSRPASTGIARYLQTCGPYPVYNNTDVTYYSQGEDAIEALKEALKKATSFVFLEYFIVYPGSVLDEVMDILKERAAAGVEIRFLYDGFSHAKSLSDTFLDELKEIGVQGRVFQPLRPFLSTDQNNRDHRKIIVIDGKVAFTGGFNLADEYANRITLYGHWKDTAVALRGPAVQTFTALFLQLWNSEVAGEMQEDFDRYFAPSAYSSAASDNSSPGFVIPYGDNPNFPNEIGEVVYMNILVQAEKYVYIMTPYLVLDHEMTEILIYTAQRGVDVKIIFPHIPDKKIPYFVAKSHYMQLLQAGIKLYEYIPGFVHAKVFLSDDKTATVGTYNMDYRSFYLHYEVGALLYDNPALKDIYNDFEQTLALCQRITPEIYRALPLWQRIVGRVFRLFAPLI